MLKATTVRVYDEMGNGYDELIVVEPDGPRMPARCDMRSVSILSGGSYYDGMLTSIRMPQRRHKQIRHRPYLRKWRKIKVKVARVIRRLRRLI